MEAKECKYRLPCGWCDRIQEKCIFEAVCEDTKIKCKQHHFVWDTKELHYRCVKCGEIVYRGYKD